MALKDFLNEQGVLDPAKLRQNKAIMGAIPKLISGNYSTQLEALDLLKKEGLTPESIMGALVQAPPAAKVTPAAPAPAPAAAATPAATPAAAAPTAPAAPAAGAPPRNAFTEGAPLMDDRIDQFGRVTPGVQTFANDAIKAARAAADAASNYAKANPGDTAGIEAARKTASAASQRAQAASMWASMSPGARQQAYSAGERATQFWNAQQQGQAAVREIQTDPQLAADLAYYNQTGVLRGAEGAGTATTPGGGTIRTTQDGARVLTSPYGTGSATFGAPPSAARTIEGVPAMEWFKRNAETTGRGNKFFTASGDPIVQPVAGGRSAAPAAPAAPAVPTQPPAVSAPPTQAQFMDAVARGDWATADRISANPALPAVRVDPATIAEMKGPAPAWPALKPIGELGSAPTQGSGAQELPAPRQQLDAANEAFRKATASGGWGPQQPSATPGDFVRVDPATVNEMKGPAPLWPYLKPIGELGSRPGEPPAPPTPVAPTSAEAAKAFRAAAASGGWPTQAGIPQDLGLTPAPRMVTGMNPAPAGMAAPAPAPQPSRADMIRRFMSGQNIYDTGRRGAAESIMPSQSPVSPERAALDASINAFNTATASGGWPVPAQPRAVPVTAGIGESIGDVFQNTRTTGAVRMQNPQSISSAIQGTGVNSPVAPTNAVPSRTGEGLPNLSYQFDIFGNATPNPQRYGQPQNTQRQLMSWGPQAIYNPMARRFFSF